LIKNFVKISVVLFFAIFLNWGCAQKADQGASNTPTSTEATATQEYPTLTGKILDVSSKSSIISIEAGNGDNATSHLVKFDKKTTGVEHAQKGQAAIITYEMRNGQPHALSVKPKLAKLPDGVTDIKPEELNEMLDKGAAPIIVDARPGKPYAQSHIQNAISIPADEMTEKSAELLGSNKEALIVFYCGGPTCGLSTKAAGIAQKMGYKNIRIMLAGEPGWVKAGYPTYASRAFVAKGNIVLIDLRDLKDSQAGRIDRSVSIPLSDLKERIEDIPAKAPVVLYSDNEDDMLKGMKKLRESRKVSLISGGIEGWKNSGGTLINGPVNTEIKWKRKLDPGEVSVADFLKAASGKENGVVILDVRSDDEARKGKVKTATHIALDELSAKINELPKDKKIYVYCNTGARAEMAHNELKKNGFNSFFLIATVDCEGIDCDIEE